MIDGRILLEAKKKRGRLKIVISDYPKDKSEWMCSVDYVEIKTGVIRTRYWILDHEVIKWKVRLKNEGYIIIEPNETESK